MKVLISKSFNRFNISRSHGHRKHMQMFHPSIVIHFISEQGCGGAGASPSCRRLLRGWVHPQQVTSSSQHQHVETNNHSHSHSCLRSMWSHRLPASGYQNTCRHGQNVQAPHRKVCDQRDSHPNFLTVKVRVTLSPPRG